MAYIIINSPVPTPEEMGEMLGLDPARVQAVRKIMSTPIHPRASVKTVARKKASRSKAANRAAAKK